MKNYNRICLSLVLLLPFITLAQNFDPNTVLPKSLEKYNFGMSLDDFIKENKSATNSETRMSFRFEYIEKDLDKDIKEVTWYFDAENNKPLYEMIIEFNDAERLNSLCSKKLGKPNDDDGEWKWKTKEGYVFKAWRFGNKLVYALGLPFTEWTN
jgi:hypothetical protein